MPAAGCTAGWSMLDRLAPMLAGAEAGERHAVSSGLENGHDVLTCPTVHHVTISANRMHSLASTCDLVIHVSSIAY